MKTKLTHAMRMELATAIRGRYAATASKDKRRILEEFIAATGYHEKSAIRVLNNPPELKRCATRQRPSLYDEAARGALIVLWEASERVTASPDLSAARLTRDIRALGYGGAYTAVKRYLAAIRPEGRP
jgi:hypothetical protein